VRYVEFVQVVYGGIAEAILGGDSRARNFGVNPRQVHSSLACDAPDGDRALVEAVLDLVKVHVLEGDQWNVKLTGAGEEIGAHRLSDALWPSLFKLRRVGEADHEFMAKAVELSEGRHERCAAMRHVEGIAIQTALGRPADTLSSLLGHVRVWAGARWLCPAAGA
jgi:hypothetical protein